MDRNFLLVGLGGFLGSIARYLTALLFMKSWMASFPIGTFVANLLGCFVIGLVYGFSGRMEWLTPEWRIFLATGFCGGYTTFSSFMYENAGLLESAQYWTFVLYSLSSFVIGLVAVFVGIFITRP